MKYFIQVQRVDEFKMDIYDITYFMVTVEIFINAYPHRPFFIGDNVGFLWRTHYFVYL